MMPIHKLRYEGREVYLIDHGETFNRDKVVSDFCKVRESGIEIAFKHVPYFGMFGHTPTITTVYKQPNEDGVFYGIDAGPQRKYLEELGLSTMSVDEFIETFKKDRENEK